MQSILVVVVSLIMLLTSERLTFYMYRRFGWSAPTALKVFLILYVALALILSLYTNTRYVE